MSGRAIEAVQERDGAIPWTLGGHTDVWNHVEAAMALLLAGRDDAVERAWQWVRPTQRHDGSWPMKTVGGVVEDASGETNMAAYVAVGVWHHWLVRRDERFVEALWPTVRAALDFATSLPLPSEGSRGRRSGRRTARRASTVTVSSRLVEHPPRPACGADPGRAPRRHAARLGARCRAPGSCTPRPPRPLPGQVDVLHKRARAPLWSAGSGRRWAG